jgi:hypothetical protein
MVAAPGFAVTVVSTVNPESRSARGGNTDYSGSAEEMSVGDPFASFLITYDETPHFGFSAENRAVTST